MRTSGWLSWIVPKRRFGAPITVLVEDHQAAQRRLDEETRYMGRLESAITTLLEGLTD